MGDRGLRWVEEELRMRARDNTVQARSRKRTVEAAVVVVTADPTDP